MRTERENLWLVIYMTPSPQKAEAVEQMLLNEGFLVRRRALDRAVSGSGAYELCVLESEAREARELLIENGW